VPAELPADDALASVAKALAHPARIRIIKLLLEKDTCIGYDIVDEVGLAQSTVSEHLRILKAAGVVIGEIERPRVCYSLNPEGVAALAGLLDAVAGKPVSAVCGPICEPAGAGKPPAKLPGEKRRGRR